MKKQQEEANKGGEVENGEERGKIRENDQEADKAKKVEEEDRVKRETEVGEEREEGEKEICSGEATEGEGRVRAIQPGSRCPRKNLS